MGSKTITFVNRLAVKPLGMDAPETAIYALGGMTIHKGSLLLQESYSIPTKICALPGTSLFILGSLSRM